MGMIIRTTMRWLLGYVQFNGYWCFGRHRRICYKPIIAHATNHDGIIIGYVEWYDYGEKIGKIQQSKKNSWTILNKKQNGGIPTMLKWSVNAVNATSKAWPILSVLCHSCSSWWGKSSHSYPMELGQHVLMTTDWTMNNYEKLKNHSGWSLEP